MLLSVNGPPCGFDKRYNAEDVFRAKTPRTAKTLRRNVSYVKNHLPACSLGSANKVIAAEPGGTDQNPFAAPDATATYCLPLIA